VLTVTTFVKLLFSQKKEFYKSLKNILGFYPTKIEYYELALIHKSASINEPGGITVNNERLEYLGDAVLDAIVGDFLYHKFPKENEGFLTQMRSKIVNGNNLSELAVHIGLHRFIVSNTNTALSKTKILEDAFEALIGAVYLDKGYAVTSKFVIDRIIRNFVDINLLRDLDTNFKSQLIEWAQKHKKEIAFFTDFDTENARTFVSVIRIDSETFCTGHGTTKKQAEQQGAKLTLERVLHEDEKSSM
jgi:ribonuclease III